MTEPCEILYQGQWLRLVRRGRWESCERCHGGEGMAVIIIAATPDDEVLFVEQYRVPLGARTIEMPAGLVADGDDGDTLEAAARRELLEETGWRAGKLELLMTGPTSAGLTNERIAFVRASELVKTGKGGGVDGEDIIVHTIPRTEVPAWLMQKHHQGYALDLKLWAGLWMLQYQMDGSPRLPD
ncbi:MAG: NUDIX hydrolase [Pseudomonadota bacterium]|nr:NUDIX hydrolase [Pseudomonadota bacterium]